jgi:hypothetical protein
VCEIISGKNQAKVINPKGQYPIYGSSGILMKDYVASSFHVEKEDFELDPFNKNAEAWKDVAIVWWEDR